MHLQQAPGAVAVLKDIAGAWSVFLLFIQSGILKRESLSRVASLKITSWGLPWWLNGGNNPPANAGDSGSIPGRGRSHVPRTKQASEPYRRTLLSSASMTSSPYDYSKTCQNRKGPPSLSNVDGPSMDPIAVEHWRCKWPAYPLTQNL